MVKNAFIDGGMGGGGLGRSCWSGEVVSKEFMASPKVIVSCTPPVSLMISGRSQVIPVSSSAAFTKGIPGIISTKRIMRRYLGVSFFWVI